MHEAKCMNTQPVQNLNALFEQWLIDDKREGKVKKDPLAT